MLEDSNNYLLASIDHWARETVTDNLFVNNPWRLGEALVCEFREHLAEGLTFKNTNTLSLRKIVCCLSRQIRQLRENSV